ncbi:carbohydrate ABC transporter permease [Streptomyces montanisoli]|uniref:Sugar ABC transporter permease n=1 Tax=Streptomyces montanisoli TaxID=2798581 RepID=A0A940MHC2_9ACTN|nr:sugar ABC transporter permease [Streptomyces montanisoli]MBP0460858.1 sugar ABC transporter permease [Streptomyces montanisoli]
MTATVTSPSARDAGGEGMSGTGGARKKPRIPGRLRRSVIPYVLLLPAILFELLVHVIPMIVGVVISFRQLTLFFIHNWGAAPWSGLKNYQVAVDFNSAVGKSLLHSFWITVVFTVASVGLCWLFGTTAAIMLQDKFRGRGTLRTIFLIPYALPVYAAVITWAFMFQRDNGMVNHLIHDQLHLTDHASFWLIGNNSFVTLLVVSLWKGWPFAFLIVMAGLQNIPGDLYEAAAIDGAGMWQQIRKITMPSLRSVNQVLVLVLFLWTFNDFNTPFVLFGKNGNAPGSADLISFHIYQSSFSSWNFGSGSAMSVLLLLFLLVVTGVYLAVTSRGRKASDG